MLQTLFPKTVYVKNNLLLNRLSSYKFCIEKQFRFHGSDRHGLHFVESSHATFYEFHLLPEFQDLVQEIYKHTHDYLKLLGYHESTISGLQIQRMWANISQKGDYLYPHLHGESLISGAFYITSDSTDKLKFFNDLSESFLKPADFTSEYNQQYCEYDCVPGRLLLFKSNFLHGTEAQKSNQKIVLSFNIG